jgi:Spy/CpxP family protein refolding chaperone
VNLNSIRIGIITATISLAAIAPSATWALTPTPAPTSTPNSEVQPSTIPGKIQLTQDQLKKIEAIRNDRNKKIVAVLTPDQRTKFTSALKDEQKIKEALRALNLTKDQKDKIVVIGKKSADDMIKVLTPEQQKQLQQLQQAQTKKK